MNRIDLTRTITVPAGELSLLDALQNAAQYLHDADQDALVSAASERLDAVLSDIRTQLEHEDADTSTDNPLLFLAEQHAALADRAASAWVCSVASSHAETLQADIAESLELLGALVLGYPAGTGNETELMPQLGHLLRVLGAAASFAHIEGCAAFNAEHMPRAGQEGKA